MHFYGGTNHYVEECYKRIRKEEGKYRAGGGSDNRRTERTPHKCFRCGSEYHLIAKCLKPHKDNDVSMKELIVHRKKNPITLIMTMIKRYMYIWHVCLIMTKVPVYILVTVRN